MEQRKLNKISVRDKFYFATISTKDNDKATDQLNNRQLNEK